MHEALTARTMRRGLWVPSAGRNRVRFPYKNIMAVTLICPKCQQHTELRGTLDAYYLTWCPDCERLWRFEIWSLLHADETGRKMPWATER